MQQKAMDREAAKLKQKGRRSKTSRLERQKQQ
jgi:hypothetical protein